jgi:transcriptional regulator with XRE-family HTH domain
MSKSFDPQITVIVKKYFYGFAMSGKKLSQEDFADAIGTHRLRISKILNGREAPSIFLMLDCIAKYTDWRFDMAKEILKVMVPSVEIQPVERTELVKAQ